MEAITVPVYNAQGKEVETLTLDTAIFGGIIHDAAIHQAVVAYRAGQRKGLAQTKTRGEVSGGGVKPWRQKGTGRARHGSIRSPLWRHGGVVFGPHPRDFSFTIPEKIKRLALTSALSAKVKESSFVILDSFNVQQPKTKEAVKVLANLKLYNAKVRKPTSVLFLLDTIDSPTRRVLRNIQFLDINYPKDTHAYEVLSHQKLLITKEGVKQLTQRLKQ